MALRELRIEGDEILAKVSKPVKKLDQRTLELIEDMRDTMRNANGAGIAAVQVGVLKRLFLIDTEAGKPHPKKENIITFINPEIIERSGSQTDIEGCLSVPNQSGIVTRSYKVKCKYLDENWEEQVIEGEGFFAKALQHETDHINGMLYNSKADIMNPSAEEMEEYCD